MMLAMFKNTWLAVVLVGAALQSPVLAEDSGLAPYTGRMWMTMVVALVLAVVAGLVGIWSSKRGHQD
jgi:hypothetical protein